MSTHSDSSLSSTPTILPLPPRAETAVKQQKPPVWPIDASEAAVPTPLHAKCARNARDDGICCKELLDDERTLIDPDVVRDVYVRTGFRRN